MADNSITTVLVIAAIGMALLFLSLVLFYGLLSLLTALVKDRPRRDQSKRAEHREDRDLKIRQEEVLRAAAIAVVLARAEAERRPGSKLAGGVGEAGVERTISPWWSLHHQRQLGPHPGLRRVR